MNTLLGKLKEIDLREAWKHEANHFTTWLAQEENLTLLGDEIGYDMKLVSTEANVGDFIADILAEEENTGKKIIIENQLEVTNHGHLGQLITYASGYNAKIIVWIVKDAREEHRRAIDWLNEHTDEDTEFFLVKIELWQIADSPFAPKFDIVSKPNDWAKTVKESVPSNLTDTKIRQLDFWNKFKEYGKARNTSLRFKKAYPQHWTDISIGSGEAYISLTIHSTEKEFRTELYIPNNKALFAKLLEHRQEIDKEIGEAAEWMELPGKKASRIKVLIHGDLDNMNAWDTYFAWLLAEAQKFQAVFPKYLRD